jgi:hypothetical protein
MFPPAGPAAKNALICNLQNFFGVSTNLVDSVISANEALQNFAPVSLFTGFSIFKYIREKEQSKMRQPLRNPIASP